MFFCFFLPPVTKCIPSLKTLHLFIYPFPLKFTFYISYQTPSIINPVQFRQYLPLLFTSNTNLFSTSSSTTFLNFLSISFLLHTILSLLFPSFPALISLSHNRILPFTQMASEWTLNLNPPLTISCYAQTYYSIWNSARLVKCSC